MVGENLYFVGASFTFDSGNRLVHGQQVEVVGPAKQEAHRGKGLEIRFPDNTNTNECYLSELSRIVPVCIL